VESFQGGFRVNDPGAAIERKVLSEAFQQALQGWRIRSAVFLTFRFDPGFFEQEILPVFFDIPLSHAPVARVIHLADKLRETGPIAVYYDRRALEPGAASAKTDFQRIGVSHRTGYFHPKNVVLLAESTAPQTQETATPPVKRLIVGAMSANLTRAGWWENVEVAHIEAAEEASLCGFRDDLLALISLLHRVAPETAAHSALDEIHSFVRKLEQDPQRLSQTVLIPRLLAGDRDLSDFIEEIAGHRLRNRCLEVISPYFDDKESLKPLRELIQRFRPRETRVFLPRGAEGEALCSEEYWKAVREAEAVWGTLPADVVRLSRDRDRFVHAKVYRFFDPNDRRETFFVGSVNLTNAGFGLTGNVESGFIVEREAKRRNAWWLEVDDRHPAQFTSKTESEGLVTGPGCNLVLRFDWTTGVATAFWDADSASPRLAIRGAGVLLGELAPIEPQQPVMADAEFSKRLREHLLSSAFVTVAVEGEADATILVDEIGALDKPSLLATLSPQEILQYWSLLTDAQKQEFIEIHAGELGDEELHRWMGGTDVGAAGQGIFGTFAHLYLSFGNLERTVRRALSEGRPKEATDRLFGKKFDSLRKLYERTLESPSPEPVREYVTLLCAVQLLNVVRKDHPDFYKQEAARFDLVDEIRAALGRIRTRFTFGDEGERAHFFEWFDRWFLQRATPSGDVEP